MSNGEDEYIRFRWTLTTPILLVWSLLLAGFIASIMYEHYREALIDAQAPVVETCVHHRVSQHVTVSP